MTSVAVPTPQELTRRPAPMLSAAALLVLAPLAQDAPDPRLTDHLIARIPDGIELPDDFPFATPIPKMPIATRPTRRVGFDSGESHHAGWTADGLEVAYVGSRGEEYFPIVNDRVGDPYRRLFAPTVGPRAGDVAFRAVNGSGRDLRWVLLHEGDAPVEHYWIGKPTFSPDGSKLIYWTQPEKVRQPRGAKSPFKYVLHGLSKRPAPKMVINLFAPIRFLRDGRSAVTIAVHNGRWSVLRVSKSKEKVLGEVSRGFVELAVRPDGKSWAASGLYTQRTEGKQRGSYSTRNYRCVLHDGKRLAKGYWESGVPVFSPDGKHLAYRVIASDPKAASPDEYGLEIDGKRLLVPEHGFVTTPVWHPKSKSLAYIGCPNGPAMFSRRTCQRLDSVERGGNDQVYVLKLDGAREELGGPADRIEKLTWSPDGERLSWVERRSSKWWVIAGNSTAGPYDEVGPLQFDEGGEHLAFGTREGREFWWRTLDVR